MPKLVFIRMDGEELHLNHSYSDHNDAAGDLRGDAFSTLREIHGAKADCIKEIRIVSDNEEPLIKINPKPPYCDVCGELKPNQFRYENDRPILSATNTQIKKLWE